MDSEKLEDIVDTEEESTSKNPDFILVDDIDAFESCPDEVSASSEFLDELDEEEEKENAKFVKTTRIFWGVLTAISAVLLCCLIYMKYIMWNPTERELCQDNLFCGSSLAISPDELDDVCDSLEKSLGINIEDEFKDEYALLYAVLENDCLTEDEKNVFYGFIDIIKDNPYIDREEAYRSLRNVDVLHKCRPYYFDKTVQGAYSHEFESIGIFEKDEDNLILKHEGIHAIFCNDKTINLPKYFKEGMTELLVNEYFESKPFVELVNYPFEIAGVKILCEVTSPDVVLKAFSTGDMDIIAQDMATITGDIEVARKALDAFGKVYLKHYGELEEDLSYEDIVNECIPVFRGIVTAKYEEKDANRVSYFYNEILLGNIFQDGAYDKYVDDLVEFGSDHKAYFSSKLKTKLASEEIVDKISDDEKTYKKEK